MVVPTATLILKSTPLPEIGLIQRCPVTQTNQAFEQVSDTTSDFPKPCTHSGRAPADNSLISKGSVSATRSWWPHNLTRSKSATLRETHFFFNSASQFISSVSG
jgi:hypothetical protein